jgi:hypothetical protein
MDQIFGRDKYADAPNSIRLLRAQRRAGKETMASRHAADEEDELGASAALLTTVKQASARRRRRA